MVVSRDNRLSGYQNLAASVASGAVSRSLTAPLDVVKILRQVGTDNSRNGLVCALRNVYRTDGIRGLWKGNAVGCARILPHSLIILAVYSNMQRLTYHDDFGPDRLTATIDLAFLSSIAGITATTITYPMDLIKTRLIVQQTKTSYKGFIHATCRIYCQEGYLTFWRGLALNLYASLGYALTTCFTFVAMETVMATPPPARSPSMNFLEGCIVSAASMTVCFPLETIKRKIQARSHFLPNHGDVDVCFSNQWDAFTNTVKRYGVRGLWRGLFPALIRVAPYNGLLFVTYNASRNHFIRQNGYLYEVDHNLGMEEMQEGVGENLEYSELFDD